MGSLDKLGMTRPGWLWVLFGVVIVLALGAWLFVPKWAFAPTDSVVPEGYSSVRENMKRDATGEEEGSMIDDSETDPTISVVAENLEVPWAIDWLPNGAMLVTERPGRLQYFLAGEQREIAVPGSVRARGEGGLLGVAVHPEFARNRWMYIYRTTEAGAGTVNTVERYRLTEDLGLTEREVLLGEIPGAAYHDGGALKFGPDGLLYITTGDAGQEQLAQDRNSLAGKILRLEDDGSVPADNPLGTPVWSWGHRNPQGLAWDANGQLWATEHGRSGALSGLDEINRIEAGANYGWPIIEGDEQEEGMNGPVIHSGAEETWAPAGATFWQDNLFFGGLRGQSLYEADVEGSEVVLQAHFREELGRIRAAAVGPDGALYITTSNQDGRGTVQAGDDKILRIGVGALDGV